jgi:hypothetical protein
LKSVFTTEFLREERRRGDKWGKVREKKKKSRRNKKCFVPEGEKRYGVS